MSGHMKMTYRKNVALLTSPDSLSLSWNCPTSLNFHLKSMCSAYRQPSQDTSLIDLCKMKMFPQDHYKCVIKFNQEFDEYNNVKPSLHLEFDPGLAWSSTTEGLPEGSAQLTELGHHQVPCLYPKFLPQAAGAMRILIAHSKRGTEVRSSAALGNHQWLLFVSPLLFTVLLPRVFFFRQRLPMLFRLFWNSLNSLCIPGWPQIHNPLAACYFSLLSPRITCVYHHTWIVCWISITH